MFVSFKYRIYPKLKWERLLNSRLSSCRVYKSFRNLKINKCKNEHTITEVVSAFYEVGSSQLQPFIGRHLKLDMCSILFPSNPGDIIVDIKSHNYY